MKLLLASFCVFISFFSLHATDVKDTEPMVIILLGPPGSGKGTQALRLSQKLKIPHISTGDLFRENLSKNTELGKKVKSYMEAGKLVPDELVLDMLFARISQPDSARGYLLDGFPRTIPQAEALEKQLNAHAKIIALNLQVPDEVIVKRAAGRLTCKKCGHMYNKYFAPPSDDNVCDKCKGELYQRADDAPAVVEERLHVYHQQTEALIQFYEKKGILVNVNGVRSPEAVYQELLDTIQKAGLSPDSRS
jgi:adenylate kinase